MLVLTPPPHHTECVSGYLMRLGAANGYPSSACVVQHIHKAWHNASFRHVSAQDMVEITGMTHEQAQRVCLVPEKGLNRTLVKLLGVEMHVSEVRMTEIRICPLCVKENGRHEALWHLALVDWCPLHRIPLLETCEWCKTPLRWKRPSVGVCKCGADLTVQGGRKKCSVQLASLLTAVRAAMYQDPVIQPFPAHIIHLSKLDLYALSRFIFVLSDQLERLEGSGRHVAVFGSHLEKVAKLLTDWPHNFQRFLTRHYEAILVDDTSRVSFRRVFAWVFQRLVKHLKDRGKGFDFLTDEIYRFGSKYLSRDRLYRETGKQTFRHHQGKWGSITQAAAVIGIDHRTLGGRIKAGDVPIRRIAVDKRNRNVMVDLDWARELKRSSESSLSDRQAAERVGITTAMLKTMRAKGYYACLFHTRRKGGYSVEDVETLRLKLMAVAAKHSADGTVSKIAREGVSMEQTKSREQRAEMLGGLMSTIDCHGGQHRDSIVQIAEVGPL